MPRTLAVILAASLMFTSGCQRSRPEEPSTKLNLPQGWEVMEPSTAETAITTCANYSENDWFVTAPNGSLQVQKVQSRSVEPELPPRLQLVKDMAGERCALRLGQGWLLGFDAGEFGGGLWRTNADGSGATRLLAQNVQAIVGAGNRVLIFTGLAHMDIDEGSVYYIPRNEPESTPKLLANLGAAPSTAIPASESSVLVATSVGIFNVSTATGELSAVFRKPIGNLYPTSMVIARDRSIAIGMRFFVLRLIPSGNTYRPEWIVPSECRTFEQRGMNCRCTASLQ